MLERLVAWVLNKYLGKYVENLNTDQLSIALLQGSVELENLPLRKDAFRQFGLPVHIKYGLIGKMKLKVPVTQLRSAPWIIVLEYVTIVLKPLSLNEWDEEAEEIAAHECKMSVLDSLEAKWRAMNYNLEQENSYYASSYNSWFNYGSGFVTNILENIQLEIKNVHIRYEDNVTTEDSFATGIMIDSLSVQSCNEEWCPGYRCWDAGDKYSFQLLQLSALSFYFDKIPESEFWDCENLDMSTVVTEKHEFILLPVCAEARVKRNRSSVPLRSRTQPRIICDLQLETVSVLLTDVQYIQVAHCLKGLRRIQRNRKYLRFRPASSVKENPKAWWTYCLNCYRYKLRGSVEKFISWDQCFQRARENVAYVKLYTELLSNATGPSITDSEQKELKNKVEWERGFEELRILREVAMLRTKSPCNASIKNTLSNTGRSTLFQWFPQWWGWYSTAENLDDTKASSSIEIPKMNSQLESIEDEILDVIADTVENNTILRRDTVFGHFNFSLKDANIRLHSKNASDDECKCAMELLFNNVRLELESRPRSSSSRFHISLGSVTLNDYLTENSIFPVLISPQNSEDAPSGKVNRNVPPTIAKLLNHSSASLTQKSSEPLFQLTYEYKPFSSVFDYKLHIKSQSLDIVYNADAIKWLLDFFVKRHQKSDIELKKVAKLRYYSMKQKTKEEFLKNWENILQGHEVNRQQWDIKLDISAPQIFLAEHFTDRNTIICIIDFGKLYFTNNEDAVFNNVNIPVTQNSTEFDITEEDDEEAFATPCSTPAASEVSDMSDSRRTSAEEITKNIGSSMNESNFHNKIYASYKIEFNDLQVLLGRMKDNWKFAHLKGTSSLHVLDKFNISLQIERRVIYTTDPQYPALMILGNLPQLIVHANEHKVQAMRSIYDTVFGYWAQTPFRSPETFSDELLNDLDTEFSVKVQSDSPNIEENQENSDAKLFIIQFIINQLALEIQSRGRSIAELQVSGVKALFTKRPIDTSLTLSVHSLLLVDALQTFGPDFELLLASHKHVGMDSISGSLKDSEPTSPISPGSPDPTVVKNKMTTPNTLLQALSSLYSKDESLNEGTSSRFISTSPLEGDGISVATTLPTFSDAEALILVDIVFIKGTSSNHSEIKEDMQIASIQFNNLDVVANQETIVELISFTRRVVSQFQFNQKYSQLDLTSKVTPRIDHLRSSSPFDGNLRNLPPLDAQKTPPTLTKTELTFDFHRLNILLLRSMNLDGGITVARKIATATMTDAKIHATVGDDLLVEGSLGGLQVLDLTNDGHVHQRIFSVGQDPVKLERCILSREKRPSVLFEHLSADIYNMKSQASADKLCVPTSDNVQAFNFIVKKSLKNKLSEQEYDITSVKVRFSSALYTHAPHFVAELSNYATEFKQYLKNLARSIGSAATEMALGLVHARTEALALSLAIGQKQSLYGSNLELGITTPRKQWIRSPSIDIPTEVNTTFNTLSPADYDSYPLKIKLDVVIDSPVIILPRYATSYEVFVAHLGRISINNENSDEVTGEHGSLWTVKDRYNVEVRDMNLYSLNVEKKIQLFSFRGDKPVNDFLPPAKADDIYDCTNEGKPILHDTIIHVFVERDLKVNGQECNFLEGSLKSDDHSENIQICGRISTDLKFSLTRQQYEQLIETADNVLASLDKGSTTIQGDNFLKEISSHFLLPNISEDIELRSNVSALDLDPTLRARMLQRHSSGLNVRSSLTYETPIVIYNVNFEVPVFTVELKADFGSGERGLVELSFSDFVMQYERCNQYEVFIQMSLQSLVMEDLQREPNSKHRYMMMSSIKQQEQQTNADFISTSCPNLSDTSTSDLTNRLHSSLPDYLEMETVFGGFVRKSRSFFGVRNNTSYRSVYQQKTKSNEPYPVTPPPSPRERRSPNMYNEDNLVHISVILYSKESEQFFSNKLYRTVNVDFNSLNMIVNVQSWVVVLDFFGLTDDQLASTHPTSYSKPVSRRHSGGVSFLPINEYEMHCYLRSELDITVKSLSLILNRTEYEVAKANISNFNANIVRESNAPIIGDITTMEGHIGNMSLSDLTPTHGKLYNERFITSGLDFYVKRYSKPDRLFTREYDIDLKLNMPFVTYTHTQRFAFDLQTYYKTFTQLQKIFNNIRSASMVNDDWDLPTRVKLDISATSPVIILPVSSQHREVLIIDLGNLSVTNTFKWSDSADNRDADETQICLLDVMEVNLVNMDLFIGEWISSVQSGQYEFDKLNCLNLGSYSIKKHGSSLLQEKCELKLQVDRNLSAHIHKTVPDMSFTGVLSTLAVTVDFSQYILLCGLLMYNVGECLDDLFAQNEDIASTFPQCLDTNTDIVWRTNCINLDLVNVSVRLLSTNSKFSGDSLACVNFIKSHLTVESYSDKSQDVDLVSQEILITDTRFLKEPVNKRSNIFTNILQPLGAVSGRDNVRVEVHHRKREDKSKFTILLNNMRLMAILDWWEMVRDFVICDIAFEGPVPVARNSTHTRQQKNSIPSGTAPQFEVKLNITNSEIVVLEDSTQWDSNAVIFKSTTVINYKPGQPDKILSCNFNHCELFSCILGMEDETALSIVDPVTINCELTTRCTNTGEQVKVLQVSSHQLYLRLSYHDVKMFMQILKSLPKQTAWARKNDVLENEVELPANIRNQINRLRNLGFASKDCLKALEMCNGNLDDAALWLTQYGTTVNQFPNFLDFTLGEGTGGLNRNFGDVLNDSALHCQQLQFKTECLNICIIDDCQDSDVPLLELSFTNLFFEKDINSHSGETCCLFAVDYYNRFLSGWEPFLEPWSCKVKWYRSSNANLSPNRLVINLSSQDTLKVNVTRTIIDLYKNVKEVWTQDYYNPKDRVETDSYKQIEGSCYRRRSPFIPFALRNDTGCLLSISTSVAAGHGGIISSPDMSPGSKVEEDCTWHTVGSGETIKFSFEEQEKRRHRDTHMVKHHQITVKVLGWKAVKPVSVDRVGVYFRHALPDNCSLESCDLPQARIVFDVTLEGSARKLITVRSALLLHNQLELPVEVRLENTPTALSWRDSLTYTLLINPGKCEPVPLTHTHAQISLRPIITEKSSQVYYAFSNPIFWQRAQRAGDLIEEMRQCHSNKGSSYRFCGVIRREQYPYDHSLPQSVSSNGIWTHPGHVIAFISPMVIVNLLPYDLYYNANDVESGRIYPGQQVFLHEVSSDLVTEIIFFMDSYPGPGRIIIPSAPTTFTAKLKLHDNKNRKLYVNVSVTVQKGHEVQVSVFASFWLINRTALPLVFRQEGGFDDAAGQYEEHEIARMVAPLMFSHSDPEASPMVIARLGAAAHRNSKPQWCQHFHLHVGVQVRRLRVSMNDPNRPDKVYMIGINVRRGRGRYRHTYIVTLSAHYQIHNKSSWTLEFAQKCCASTVSDPGAEATYIQASPNCYLPYHWPRLDKEQILCLRILNVPGCLWSGGFKITNDAFHVNVRDQEGRMHFLRVEIVLQDATYFVVFTDAETIPPPIRLDNFSQVNLHFHQMMSDKYCMIRAHSSVPYVWDEPILPHTLTIIAPGGVSANYDVNQLGKAADLTYENFIYIGFTATFNNINENGTTFDMLDVQQQQLVLDVLPNSDHVILNRKEIGARSQFWRMTSSGELQHEGSSPPVDPTVKRKSKTDDNVLVLDIAGPALQPKECVNLALRKRSQRRKSTQTWRFTEDGRLCCAHNNMCVQARDGFFGLRKGNDAVLGPMQSSSLQITEHGVPFEQAISRQKLRPGSGFLSVNVTTDGPTRVIEIIDIQDRKTCVLVKDCDWVYVDKIERPTIISKDAMKPIISDEFELNVGCNGVSFSLISRKPPEELVLCHMSGIRMNYVRTCNNECIELSVKDVQIDNQLFEAQCDVLLYVMPSNRNTDPEEVHRPALQVSSERTLNNFNVSSRAEIIKSLLIRVKNLCVILEERLLLKLLAFAEYNNNTHEQENMEENDFETQQILADVSSMHSKRYYFEILELVLGQIRLSVLTNSKLTPQLRGIKKKFGLTLLKFEDATIDLKPFMRFHFFETSRYLIHMIGKHFREEFKWQAAVILGSVDFLGNPLGFVNDVSEGVSGLIYEGNIGALVQNVTHGLSNSAAKVTETLSDGLGIITMDEDHDEIRRKIRSVKSGTGGDHLMAGLKGLGFGLLGGVTSVFKQTYEGAASEGVQGFVTGLGKGIVGTVTKPVVGMLDLASETATAVRDSSRSSNKIIPNRIRKPRCVMGPTGLLPIYSAKQSLGQELLYAVNNHNYSEVFVAYEVLRTTGDNLQIIVSSEMVRVLTRHNALVLQTHLRDLYVCQPLIQDTGRECIVYIELFVRSDGHSYGGTEKVKRPRVRCENEGIAAWVSEQINYAKNIYIERQHTLVSVGDNASED